MSIKAYSWAWEQRIKHPGLKLTLLALAEHADAEGLCWPSINRLCLRVGLSRRSVERLLAQLEYLGFITRERRERENGSKQSNYYHLAMSKTEEAPDTDDTPHPTPLSGLEPSLEPIRHRRRTVGQHILWGKGLSTLEPEWFQVLTQPKQPRHPQPP